MTAAENTKQLRVLVSNISDTIHTNSNTYSHLSSHGIFRGSLHELGLDLFMQEFHIPKELHRHVRPEILQTRVRLLEIDHPVHEFSMHQPVQVTTS